jgi:hypothetical protein
VTINSVFFYLHDNEYFTDDLGEIFLKLMPIGTNTVTRRPTVIKFKDCKERHCLMEVSFGDQVFHFGDKGNNDSIADLLALTSPEGIAGNGKIYAKEITISITAPGLATRSFTDRPGLVADDRLLSDPGSIETLKRKNNHCNLI